MILKISFSSRSLTKNTLLGYFAEPDVDILIRGDGQFETPLDGLHAFLLENVLEIMVNESVLVLRVCRTTTALLAVEFEIYYGVGLLNKFEISPTDQRLMRRVKRMEPRFMKLTRELEWIAERIKEHPRYP